MERFGEEPLSDAADALPLLRRTDGQRASIRFNPYFIF